MRTWDERRECVWGREEGGRGEGGRGEVGGGGGEGRWGDGEVGRSGEEGGVGRNEEEGGERGRWRGRERVGPPPRSPQPGSPPLPEAPKI